MLWGVCDYVASKAVRTSHYLRVEIHNNKMALSFFYLTPKNTPSYLFSFINILDKYKYKYFLQNDREHQHNILHV